MKRKLSLRELNFCEEFLITNGNAEEAARRAGYSISTARKQAFSWVRETREASFKPHLWDRVEERRRALEDEYHVNQGAVLKGMHRIADADPVNLFNDFGDFLNIEDIDEATRKAITGIEYHRNGTIKKIKLGDRMTAWSGIAKMLGYNAAEAFRHDAGESFLDFLKQATAQSGR